MDIQHILTQLKEQVSRIDKAIAALDGLSRQDGGRPSIAQRTAGRRGPRRMSPAARAKIAAAQRARWARQKGNAGAKRAKTAKPKPARRKPMSAASRKKLSALMKARWAARKKAA